MKRFQRSQYFTDELYNRMSDDLHLAGMAERTHEGYLRAVRQLAEFAKRSPDQVTEHQVRKFFLHLKNGRHFATGSLHVAFSGLKFFYTRTCRREWQTLAQMKIQNVRSLLECCRSPLPGKSVRCCAVVRLRDTELCLRPPAGHFVICSRIRNGWVRLRNDVDLTGCSVDIV